MYVLNPPPPHPNPNRSGILQLGPKRKKWLATPLKMAGPTLLFFSFWFEHLISGPKITRTFEKCAPVSNKWKWNKYPRDIVAFLLLAESKYFQFGTGAIGRGTVTLSRNTLEWLRGGLANEHTHTHTQIKTKTGLYCTHSTRGTSSISPVWFFFW